MSNSPTDTVERFIYDDVNRRNAALYAENEALRKALEGMIAASKNVREEAYTREEIEAWILAKAVLARTASNSGDL